MKFAMKFRPTALVLAAALTALPLDASTGPDGAPAPPAPSAHRPAWHHPSRPTLRCPRRGRQALPAVQLRPHPGGRRRQAHPGAGRARAGLRLGQPRDAAHAGGRCGRPAAHPPHQWRLALLERAARQRQGRGAAVAPGHPRGRGRPVCPGPVQADQLKLSISGAGSVRFDQLQAQQLQFDISGAGEGTLSGQANELMLRVSGKGRLQADQLKTQTAKVHISGIGNATLWVTDKLGASISGIGGVDYYGQPRKCSATSPAWARSRRAKAKALTPERLRGPMRGWTRPA